MNEQEQPAVAGQVERPVRPQRDEPDRLLLRELFAVCEATEDECADTDDNFKRGRAFEAKRIRRGIGTWYQDEFCGRTFMGEPALEVAPDLAEIKRLRTALLECARKAEALKRDCGMDPESAQAVRNSQYQAISTTAHAALGTLPEQAASWQVHMDRESIAMLWNSLPIDLEAEAIVSFVRGVERWHGIGA